MRVTRVVCTSWTSSFRNPAFVVGTQPSLVVPPLSTVYGLLSAAAGRLVTPEETSVGYRFCFGAKVQDLESTYELGKGLRYKTNVLLREVLVDCKLILYVENPDIAQCLKKPVYPLLLGRSSDLLAIDEWRKVELVPAPQPVYASGTLVPFEWSGGKGFIHALPTYFSDEIPRRPQGVSLFSLFDKKTLLPGKGLWVEEEDEEKWGLFMYGRHSGEIETNRNA